MKKQNSLGFSARNTSSKSDFFAQSIKQLTFVSSIIFIGMLFSNAFAQQETVILTSGSSWVVPDDAVPSSITIECWGAGGGGAYGSQSESAGGGGGGGAYASKVFTTFTVGQSIDYQIGIGGAGSTGSNSGGDTWFSIDDATGVLAAGGKGAANNSAAGSAGGNVNNSFGDVKYNGGKGGNGSFNSGAVCGNEQGSGGGGAAATPNAIGANGGNATSQTGGLFCAGNESTGGTAGINTLFTGTSSSGGVGVEYSGDTPTNGTGKDGSFGGGGSGSIHYTYNGGKGGDGLIRITYTKVVCNVATTQTDGINLSADEAGATYQWIDCDNGNAPIPNATNKDFTALENGSYAVIVSKIGCSDTSACLVVNSVGLNDFNAITGISIYPNPTNNVVTVQFESIQDHQYTLELLDATGRMLTKQLISNSSTTISLSDFKSGVYIIRISNEDSQSIHRVIKE